MSYTYVYCMSNNNNIDGVFRRAFYCRVIHFDLEQHFKIVLYHIHEHTSLVLNRT